jgi:chemotaxis protein MotB
MLVPARRNTTPSSHRWLLPYADFLTLLFAVFVVLFAAERSGKNSVQELSRAMLAAVHRPQPAPAPAEKMSISRELTDALRQEIGEGKIEVRAGSEGLVVSLRQAAFFPSGQAQIDPSTYPVLDRLAQIVSRVPNPIRLEGHTDSVPIHNSAFHSNWELSAIRSIRLLDLFVSRHHIDRERLSIAGFAETEPLGPNDSPDGRARNRRVDIVILNPAPKSAGEALRTES